MMMMMMGLKVSEKNMILWKNWKDPFLGKINSLCCLVVSADISANCKMFLFSEDTPAKMNMDPLIPSEKTKFLTTRMFLLEPHLSNRSCHPLNHRSWYVQRSNCFKSIDILYDYTNYTAVFEKKV